MWRIIRNDWQYYGRTRWLLGVSLGFVMVLFVAVSLSNYQSRKQLKETEAAKKEMRKQWESLKAMNPHGAAHYGTYVFKPTSLLSCLDDGVNNITGNVLKVEGHVQNEIVHSEASQMQVVSKFGKLRSSLLLQYVVPILLIFLAFSSISNEKRSGRLKLLVLQGAKLSRLTLAKTLSVWLYGMCLLVLTILIYALFNLESLSAEVWNRTMLFFVSYSLYYFIVSGLTVFLSARWKKTTVALTTMLGVWILWTIFLPSISMSSVEKWHELPSRNAFNQAMKEDRSKGIDGHNPDDEREKELEDKILKKYGVDSLDQLPINFDGIVMQADEEYGNQVWDKHFGQLRKTLKKQKQSYQMGGFLNPFISLQNTSMGFSGNDNLHHQEFLVQVENYRRSFIKMLNDEHAYGGSKTGDWGWEATNDFFRSIPDFDYKPTKLSSVISNYMIDLWLLTGWAVFTIVLIIFGTKRIQIL